MRVGPLLDVACGVQARADRVRPGPSGWCPVLGRVIDLGPDLRVNDCRSGPRCSRSPHRGRLELHDDLVHHRSERRAEHGPDRVDVQGALFALSTLNVYSPSAAVIGSPLVNFTPLRIVNVSVFVAVCLHAKLWRARARLRVPPAVPNTSGLVQCQARTNVGQVNGLKSTRPSLPREEGQLLVVRCSGR